jgi:hypothetical protein
LKTGSPTRRLWHFRLNPIGTRKAGFFKQQNGLRTPAGRIGIKDPKGHERRSLIVFVENTAAQLAGAREPGHGRRFRLHFTLDAGLSCLVLWLGRPVLSVFIGRHRLLPMSLRVCQARGPHNSLLSVSTIENIERLDL